MGTQIHAGDNYRRVVEIVQGGVLGPIKRVHVWNEQQAGRREEARREAVGEVRPRPVARAGDRRVLRGRDEQVAVELRVAALPLAVVVGVRRRHARRLRLPLHGPAVLGARPDRARRRSRATGKKTYEGDNTDAGRDAGRLPVPRGEGQAAVHLTWYHGVGGPDLDGKETYKGFGSGVLFVGEKGKLVADYGKYQLLPEEFAKDFQAAARSRSRTSLGHHKEWCEAVQDRRRRRLCNFGYSGRLAETVLLGNVAYRAGKPITWDAEKGTTGNKEPTRTSAASTARAGNCRPDAGDTRWMACHPHGQP